MNYVPNLGSLCGEDARRDAVHVAVAPVVSGGHLHPGQRVGLLPDGRASHLEPHIGVVDPFLVFKDVSMVHPGERFWLFLLPNTVTSLRHVWQHPAFKAKVPEANP